MRAYSVIVAKSLNEELRQIEGWATTPTVDRTGDIVDQYGVRSEPNIPLFLNHNSSQTVGRAFLGKATKQGIPFRAHIPNIKDPGVLKDRVDEAWHSVKHGLITAVSIGFRIVDGAWERLPSGGKKYLRSDVFELSLVPVPANSEALITAVKRLDAHHARLGRTVRVLTLEEIRRNRVVYL